MAGERTIKVKIDGDPRGLQTAATQSEQAVKGLSDKVGRAGAAISAAAGAFAGFAIFNQLQSSVSIASDLNEQANVMAVTFGDAAAKVEEFAKQGPLALGQSTLAAEQAAATFGTFGKAAGLTGDELADFSTGLVQLSTDVASFRNASPEQVVEALGAALRGESEPARQFGILLDDVTLRQQALKLGLIETTSQALTPQQKVLAAHAAIMEQTKDAQGDFARTSDGLANQQRILTAQFEDLKGKVGQQLLPVMLKAVSIFTKVVDFITQNRVALVPLIGIIAAVTIAQYAWNLAVSLNPISLIIIGIAAFIAAIILLWNNVEGFRNFFIGAWEAIKTGALAVVDWFKGIPDALGSAWSGLVDIITSPFRTAFNTISDAWNATIGKLSWTVPSWVPFIGGKTVSAQRLPRFHRGGIVPGPFGQPVPVMALGGERFIDPQGGGDPMVVQVFIGDRELTDMIDVRVNEQGRGTRRRVLAGAGAR